jgi:hypothetical protein
MKLYTIQELIVRILGLDRDLFRRKLITRHNKKIMNKLSKSNFKADNILILLPHCIQNSNCLHKVTWDKMNNCRRCGQCMIQNFLEIQEEFKVEVVVVTGGTVAREIIKNKKPDIIIAVACENDLIGGIRDVSNIPVLAVINDRPNGPCIDTFADIDLVRSYIGMVTERYEKTC